MPFEEGSRSLTTYSGRQGRLGSSSRPLVTSSKLISPRPAVLTNASDCWIPSDDADASSFRLLDGEEVMMLEVEMRGEDGGFVGLSDFVGAF